MGKAPPLPAPTETDSATPTELATEVSRVTDKSSYSIPEDGSPVTIPTRRRARDTDSKISRSSHQSQTSLLIEYFEGGKNDKEPRHPSVRVKVTPSSKSRSRSSGNDRIQITERSSRKPSYTKRISLSPNVKDERRETQDDMSDLTSQTTGSNLTSRSGGPIEVEVMPRRHGSPLIPSEVDKVKYMQPSSDISSFPADSFLDGHSTVSPQRKSSGGLSKVETAAAGAVTGAAIAAAAEHLQTPPRERSRSLSRERLVAQKAVEKVRSEKRRHRSESRSETKSDKHLEHVKSPRRRSSRSAHEDSLVSAGDSSVLTSNISGSRRSGDVSSIRSGASINNPKLLETVEDAIRRLILPELNALKRGQSQHGTSKDRRESMTSASAVSRESDVSARASNRSSGVDMKAPAVLVSDGMDVDSATRSLHKTRSDHLEMSRPEREGSEDTIRADERHERDTLAAAGLAATLAAPALRGHKSKDSLGDRKERRKRRAKSRSRGENSSDVFDDSSTVDLPPPMPLMSDINASELTRTSILSSESERPHSASEEILTPVREVARGTLAATSPSPSRHAALRTPVSREVRSPLSQTSDSPIRSVHQGEYELDEHGRKVPMHEQRSHSLHEEMHTDYEPEPVAKEINTVTEEDHPFQYTGQDVPYPLRYVPYERRGLSPIQSVSSWREDDLDDGHRERDSRLTRSTGSYDSFVRREDPRSYNSLSTVAREAAYSANKHDFVEVRQGGLAESEISQDAEFWEDQHHDNDRYRDLGSENSYDQRRFTLHDHGSPYLDRAAAGQTVRGIGAVPDYRHTPVGVESAVASLVDTSVLTGVSGQNDRRASYASYDEDSERHFTSRGQSPAKQASPASFHDDYEMNGHEHDHQAALSRETLTNDLLRATVGSTSSVSSTQHDVQHDVQHDFQHDIHDYAAENTPQRSFKERALEVGGQSSPRHSVDRSIGEPASLEEMKMTANGVPDAHDPMPEIGYGHEDSELTTNPSVTYDDAPHADWEAPLTPKPLEKAASMQSVLTNTPPRAMEAALLGATTGAIAGAALSSRKEHEDEDWQRTSEDRKRDTLVTNPYEDVSPVAQQNLLGDPLKLGYQSPNSPMAMLKDEGYISAAPNAQSPLAAKSSARDYDAHTATDTLGGDPFYTTGGRNIDGMSQGMSPIYDSATGAGIEAIKSKDIIALMDHLTVRDAQRNARDTEILVTLVRAAAEMRNSFEDMKRLLADTEDVVITEVQRNTDHSVLKAINGPRPPPKSFSRSSRNDSQDDNMTDDLPNKKKNVFRRALKGLSMRSSHDLARIEEMLVQLLGEVEGLKLAQHIQNPSQRDSFDNLDEDVPFEQDHGYEPEGNAGTSTASQPSHSGHFSNPQPRATSAPRQYETRKFSDHRISTVHEDDEDELDLPGPSIIPPVDNDLLTPTREITRGSSVPLGTPPQQYPPLASVSNENTPKTDKSKKHKSSSSSGWIPKISRWSETTASTVVKGLRLSRPNSSRKDEDQYGGPSRSGSDLAQYDENHTNPYGDDHLHSGFSQEHIPKDAATPSPIHSPDLPLHHPQRNSITLQHPQPRPGPTYRYQTMLESQAQTYNNPGTPKSADWGSTSSLTRLQAQTGEYDEDGMRSPTSARYQESSPGPERPPKEPLSPERPPKIRNKITKASPLSHEQVLDDVASPVYSSGGSPRRSVGNPYSAVPARKPTGPRSMNSSRSGELYREDAGVSRNKNRNTFGTVASDESETF